MMSTTDPVALVEQLDAAIIRRQLAELEKKRRALLVLLRAAVARERTEGATRTALEEEEVALEK
jgi:hypothetical protein